VWEQVQVRAAVVQAAEAAEAAEAAVEQAAYNYHRLYHFQYYY
jgi:hypothetical protein